MSCASHSISEMHSIKPHRFPGIYIGGSESHPSVYTCRDCEFELMRKIDSLVVCSGGRMLQFTSWNPKECYVAAGILNDLLHFPICAGSIVYSIGGSLTCIVNLSNLVGPTGQLRVVLRNTDHDRSISRDILRLTSNVWVSHQDDITYHPDESDEISHNRRNAVLVTRLLSSSLTGNDAAYNKFFKIFSNFLACAFPASLPDCVVISSDVGSDDLQSIRTMIFSHLRLTIRNSSSLRKRRRNCWILVEVEEDVSNFRYEKLANSLTFLDNGIKSGLRAKEQVELGPCRPQRRLLVLKYHSDPDLLHKGKSKSISGSTSPSPSIPLEAQTEQEEGLASSPTLLTLDIITNCALAIIGAFPQAIAGKKATEIYEFAIRFLQLVKEGRLSDEFVDSILIPDTSNHNGHDDLVIPAFPSSSDDVQLYYDLHQQGEVPVPSSIRFYGDSPKSKSNICRDMPLMTSLSSSMSSLNEAPPGFKSLMRKQHITEVSGDRKY